MMSRKSLHFTVFSGPDTMHGHIGNDAVPNRRRDSCGAAIWK